MRRLGGGLEVDPRHAARVHELAERIAHYRERYYAGQPVISDDAYDALEDELRSLAPGHPLLARVGTPTVSEYWDKARHEIPMGSLNKVTSEKELREWLARCEELLAKDDLAGAAHQLCITEKLDGLSLELIYRGGELVDGITRGDGEIGERITANVRRMRGVPHRIRHREELSVRGEIILRLSDRAVHFPEYTSTRNAAAGTARRLDGVGCEHLTVMCYDLADEVHFAREEDKLAFLSELGFATPNSYRGDVEAALALHREYSEKRRAEIDYEIDGLVVRVDDTRAQAHLGDVNRRPRGAVAFKFASPMKVSTVVDIRWETGPSGRVTPVAIVEPVELVGAVVRRASLHNVANVQRLGIGVGDEVLVSRRNDVIPYVEEVLQHRGRLEQPPEQCATCGSPLRKEGEYLMCKNPSCRARVEGRIHNWVDAVGALAWGDKLIELLVEKGLVREPLDLYRLTLEQIASLERHGKKSAENVLRELHSRKPLKLPTFLAALGIEGFSIQTARLLVSAGYLDIDSLLAATVDELAAISGLGTIKAGLIVEGLASRREEIERLRAASIGPVPAELAGPLAGKSFCITGKQSRPRKELVQLIEDAGGEVLSGVTKELDFLVIDDPDSTSSKAVKARRYGTRLIGEDELMRMLEGGGR